MNFYKLVNFEELLSPGKHSSAQVRWTYVSTIGGHQMPLLGVQLHLCHHIPVLGVGVHLTVHCILICILQNVKMTLCSIVLGHEMHLAGGYICIFAKCQANLLHD